MHTTSTTPSTSPATDTMANVSPFTPEQIERFARSTVDTSVLPTPEDVISAAKSALHWYQKPFAGLLVRNPFSNPNPGTS